MNQLTFEPVANLWVVLAIVAVMFALLLMRPGFGALTKNRRWILTALRTSAICMVLLAMLRPGCIMQIEKPQTGVVEIFVDQTRSMTLPHRATGPNRFDSLKAMLKSSESTIRRLADNNIEVRIFGFDNQLTELEIENGNIRIPELPEGEETDIGSSVYSGVQLVRNQRLLATIIASDGVQNAVDPETDLNEAIRTIREAQIPLFCIPFGLADESSQLADLSIENLADQFSVRVNNTLQVTATLTAKGFAGRQIPVQLILIDRSGKEQIVDTVQVPIRQGHEKRSIGLSYTPDKPGQYQMIVRAVPQTTETAVANNQLPSFLTVEDRGVNVLLIYGSLDHEAQLIRRSLRGDNLISVDAFPIDKRTRPSWAIDISSTIGNDKYDVILFSNIDSRAIYSATFQEENLAKLIEGISAGKGFAMLGGYHSFGPGLYHATPLANILPVEMPGYEIQELDQPPKLDYHIGGSVKIKPSKSHFITRLGQGIEGGDVWEELPAMKTPNRLVAKDTARVLIETDAGDPILLTTSVGGRVAAFAGADTWKWRTEYSIEIHKRFWRQMILWLAGQDGLTGEDVWIYMPQRRFQLGQNVTFKTGITSANEDAIDDVNFEAKLIRPDGSQEAITINPEAEDYSGEIEKDNLKSPGLYAIEVVGRSGSREIGESRTEFVIFDNDLEKSVTSADAEQLARLAYQTREFGGQVYQPEEFESLLNEILRLAPENKIEIPKRWRLADTWQDALAFVLLFVGLLTVEWFLRKKWGLV